MSRPDFGGKVVRHLENAQPYTVLGRVENNWLAIAEKDQDQLIGYVPLRAVVKSALYEETIKADQRRKRVRATQPAKRKPASRWMATAKRARTAAAAHGLSINNVSVMGNPL